MLSCEPDTEYLLLTLTTNPVPLLGIIPNSPSKLKFQTQNNTLLSQLWGLSYIYQIEDGDNKIFVDLFSGSFYISYMINKVFPNAKIMNFFLNCTISLDCFGRSIWYFKCIINKNIYSIKTGKYFMKKNSKAK